MLGECDGPATQSRFHDEARFRHGLERHPMAIQQLCSKARFSVRGERNFPARVVLICRGRSGSYRGNQGELFGLALVEQSQEPLAEVVMVG